MFKRRYFSFVDPVTDSVTKGYGYSYSRVNQSVRIKLTKGGLALHKNETSEETKEVVPSANGLKELSKEEFDSLDVSGESLLSKLAREKSYLKLKKLEARFSEKAKEITAEELTENLTPLLVK